MKSEYLKYSLLNTGGHYYAVGKSNHLSVRVLSEEIWAKLYETT